MTVVNDISDVYLEQIFPEPSLSGKGSVWETDNIVRQACFLNRPNHRSRVRPL